jgi:phosphohistidine phosphatase
MKRVFLVRHATAFPRETNISDFERSLIPKGIKEAKKIARRISKNGQLEGVLISSPANRAIETAHIFAKTWDYPVQKIILKEELYDSPSGKQLWQMIKDFNNEWHSVMIFGHDPSLSELAGTMSKGFKELLPKSGAVGFSWNTDSWSQVLPESGRLILLEFPKSGFGPEKIEKSARRELAAALGDSVSALLAQIDADSVSEIEKKIRKNSRALASDFLKKTKNRDVVLSFWLRARQKEQKSESSES